MLANNTSESKILLLSAALCLTLIANQYLWLLSDNHFYSVPIGVSILIILFFVLKTARGNHGVIFALLVLCFLSVMSLGSATESWDARSIWLFHAKRIYLDNNLLAQFDNYAAYSHNDYPVLLPAMSATLASIIGHWNEVFPKTANILFMAPPLLVVGLAFNRLRYAFLFTAGLFSITGSHLINGYMDGILSLYVVATLILLAILFLGWKANLNISKWALIAAASAHLCVLIGIKNEGSMAALIILFCLLLSLTIDRIHINITKLLLIFLPSLTLSAIWFFLCHKYGIVNDIATSSFMSTFTARLMDAGSLSLIAVVLYYKIWFLFLLLTIGLISIFQFNQVTTRTVGFLLYFGLLYSLSLFFVYLGTPHDLLWHLATSADRTTQPVLLTYMACSLILFIEITSTDSTLKVRWP